MTQLVALDLFAGAGGWDIAADTLGIVSHGVEIMAEALLTREANGLLTAFEDVWEGLTADHLIERWGSSSHAIYEYGMRKGWIWSKKYALLIASPPCQTFSRAGKGEGRAALSKIYELMEAEVYKRPLELQELGHAAGLDPRTALVLVPMAYAWRDRPQYIALEQVPTVQPVWDIFAEHLRAWGYSVWTGVLNAEQYGVPQTRRRSILMARLDGGATDLQPPAPTHSHYYVRKPEKVDPGIQRWISMAEALGWGMTERPSMAVTGGGAGSGGVEVFGNGSRQGMAKAQAEGRWRFAGAGRTAETTSRQRPRELHEPAHTITGGHTGAWVLRSNYGTHGDPEDRGERSEDQPAATITGKANRSKWLRSSQSVAGVGRAVRDVNDPALTITSNAKSAHFVGDEESVNMSLQEAQLLQTFPADFVIQGATKNSRFLQVGNAIPPVLARAVLEALIS